MTLVRSYDSGKFQSSGYFPVVHDDVGAVREVKLLQLSLLCMVVYGHQQVKMAEV